MKRTFSGWFVLLLLALVFMGCKKKEEKGLEATAPLVLPSGEGVPEEVVGYFLLGNPSELISQMEALGGKVGPVPPGAMHAMIIQSLLKLGFKDTSVIDLKGPAGIMFLNPKLHAVPMVAAYSTAGKDKVIDSLKPVWTKKGEADGALEMVREEVDTYEVFEGGAPAKPKASMSMHLKFEGRTMFAAKDAGALKAGMPHLKKTMASTTPQKGALGIFMVNNLRKAYQVELAIIPETIKQQLALDPSFAQMGDPKLMKWVLGWVIDKMIACVNQTREVAFTADFAPDGAMFQIGLVAEKDSFFQKLLAAQKRTGKPLKLLSALPQDHFLAMGMNVQWHMFKDDLLAFTAEIMQVIMGTELSKEYSDAMLQMWEVMGDEVAISEDISPDGITVVELIEVKDEAKAREVFAKVMKLTADLFSKSKEGVMGMKLGFEGPKALGDYQGIKMEAIDVTWDLSTMPPAQAQMLKTFYGDKLRMVMAFFSGNLAMTMGKKAEADMHALVDRMKGKGADAGLGASKAFQNAAGGLEQGAGGVMYMSIARLIAVSAQTTYAAMGKQAPAIKLPSSSSGLFMSFSSTPQRLVTTLRLPAQHLTELGAAIKGLMQTSMDQHR